MELGCHTYSFKVCDRARAFSHARQLGFGAVELWAGHANYLSGATDPSLVAAEARAAGLHLRAYCVGGLFGLTAGTVKERLRQAFTFAHGLGVDLVTGIIDRQRAELVDGLCTDYRMRFAIENHWYTEFARPDDYAPVLAQCSDAMGVNIDTGHFAFLGCDLPDVAHRLGSRTLNVHLKAVRTPGFVRVLLKRLRKQHRMEPALPESEDEFAPFIEALRAVGYRGLIAVEHEAEGIPVREVQQYRTLAGALLARDTETCAS